MPARRAALISFFVAVVAAALAAPGAFAAGFGQPVAVPGSASWVAQQSAMAGDGRIAVVGVREVKVGKHWESRFAATIGRAPGGFGPRRSLGKGMATGDDTYGLQLIGRADGGFVACRSALDAGPRKLNASVSCSVAPPGGNFGPFVRLAPGERGQDVLFDVVARPDGTTIVLLTRLSFGKVRETVVELNPAGAVRSTTPLVRTNLERSTSVGSTRLHALTDGTVAMAAAVPVDAKKRLVRPGVRLMPPGSTTFGAATPVTTDVTSSQPRIAGTTSLRVTYALEGNDDTSEERIVTRNADGTWAAPLRYPAAVDAYGPILDLPDGGLLAVTAEYATDPDDSDCYNPVFGRVSFGTLGAAAAAPSPATLLSRKGQIALDPLATTLSDGTVIVTWGNAVSGSGDSRLQTAIREPGAPTFHTQALPVRAWERSAELLSSPTQAALVWDQAVELGDVSRTFVSALRTTAPYAKAAPLPRHPSTPCDE